MTSLPLDRQSLRRARRVLSLAVVVTLAVPLIATNQAVAVTVDGEEHDLRTFAPTVGDALDELELEVNAADEVSPSPETELSDGLEIEVARARTVEVRVDGEVVDTVRQPVHSVAGVLEAADLDGIREEGALISPGWTAPVEDGDVVDVSLPESVALTVDGETHDLETHVGTVEHLLLDEDVPVGDDDVVRPSPDEPVAEVDEIVVERVDFDRVVEEVTLDRGEERRETDDLEKGTTRVEDEGRDGLRRDVYRLELVDGEEVDRELVDREVVTEPRDRVVLVGTRTPPPPPEPEPEPAPAASDDSVWYDLARCESGGNWSADTGNGYYGGLQFHPDTWRSVGGSGMPHEASSAEQIRRGKLLQQREGWSPWPECSRRLGLR
jgi:resuscitation-promoting factor RpfB